MQVETARNVALKFHWSLVRNFNEVSCQFAYCTSTRNSHLVVYYQFWLIKIGRFFFLPSTGILSIKREAGILQLLDLGQLLINLVRININTNHFLTSVRNIGPKV